MKQTFATLCLAACTLANAQTPPAFLGTWKVTWEGEKRPQEARLFISESGGTWKTATSSRSNPCAGREVPIELKQATNDEAAFRLKFSETIMGCNDATIKLRKLGDNVLTGTRGKAELTITRE